MATIALSGGVTLTLLEDGASTFAADVFPDLAPDRLAALLAAAGETAIRTRFNAFLLRGPGLGVTLVDCGAGGLFGEAAGRLPAALAACGVAPAGVTRLVFTHLHGDHCGGALGADGRPVFNRAEIVVQAAEARFWQGRDHSAARVLDAHAGRLRLIDGAEEIAPGLNAWPLPGHTPGHMGLRIGDGAAAVGDIVHAEHLQLPDPAIATRYDSDPALARDSRRAALAEAADRGLLVAGGHLIGGLARVARDRDGFRRADP